MDRERIQHEAIGFRDGSGGIRVEAPAQQDYRTHDVVIW
jgi:uncharacterized protein YdeI (BOF family)